MLTKFICLFQIHLNQSIVKVWIKKLKNPMTFIKFSQTIDGVYENLEDYNPTKKRNVSIVFDDMIRRLIG